MNFLNSEFTWTADTGTNNTGAFSSRSAHLFIPSSRALVANECQATSEAKVHFTLHTQSSKQSFDVEFAIRVGFVLKSNYDQSPVQRKTRKANS